MRKNKKRSSENIPTSPISAYDYAKLSKEEQASYRSVASKREKLPAWCLWLYGVAAFCVALYIAFMLSPTFADFFNQYISSAGRWLLATLTAWIPFSVGELCIWLLPVILVFALVYAFKYACDTWRSALVFMGCMLCVITTLFSLFTLNFAAGYRGSTLDQKLELEKKPVSTEQLYATAEYLREMVNEEATHISYAQDGFSMMPYSLDIMRDHLDDAYTKFCAQHDFISHSPGVVKPVLLSRVMSYMHTTGVYTFFTGEANINVDFPDYTIPYTAAHEMAHQRGVAREDEANFIAFLVCMSSDDPYLRYSGYLNLYEYVLSALAAADDDLYAQSYRQLSGDVKREMLAYSSFFEQYRHSVTSQISGAVNDTFLQSQGTVGTQSYGMVVDLAVAYYEQQTSPS